MDEQLARSIGERGRFHRSAGRQNKTVVAGLVGITADYLYQIERGMKLPSVPVLTRLAEVPGVSVAELLGQKPATSIRPSNTAAGDTIYRAMRRSAAPRTSAVVIWSKPGSGLPAKVSPVRRVVIEHAPSAARDPRRRRQLGIRNTLWMAWLRRPLPSALRQTGTMLRSVPRDWASVVAFGEAFAGLSWVVRERRVVPAAVERGLRLLEEPQRHSPARRYVG